MFVGSNAAIDLSEFTSRRLLGRLKAKKIRAVIATKKSRLETTIKRLRIKNCEINYKVQKHSSSNILSH